MNNEPKVDDNRNLYKLINDKVETKTSEGAITNESLPNNDSDRLLKLPSGKALTLDETYQVTAVDDTKVIVLIGPADCGKTTIETTLYQMFQKDIVNDYYFAGSKTLQTYEQNSYYTRTKSGEDKANTPRTARRPENIFLHLKLWNCKTNKYSNLLFADLSGEDFEADIANVENMKADFNFIKSANYIIGVLDGQLISDINKRNGTFEEMAQLLRTIFDAGLFNSSAKLQIILSKYDIVAEKSLHDNKLLPFIGMIKGELKKRFIDKKYIDKIDFYNIAAMPEIGNEKFELGYGIKEILDIWGAATKKELYFNNKNSKQLYSEFDRLYGKLLGDSHE